jgi:Tfp pilus assembly pilus retraction ATPase PilT
VATTELTDWILEAMDQGATALYLRAGKAPSARIDGQVEVLALEPLPVALFEHAGATMSAGEEGWQPAGDWAWSKHIPGTGSVHCQAFTDGQGGGFVVQLPVAVAGLDEQVPRHIRNACETGEGLIVLSAPFAEDVAAMVGAVVASTTHRRAGHIISFGTNGSLERVAGNAFISDRPLPAGAGDMRMALHAALRERPDLLVVLASDPLPAVDELIAAAVGRLVIVGTVARTSPRALEMLMQNMGPSRHVLASTFKAACSWRGFRVPGGKRVVVSDSLVASDTVCSLIEAGDSAGLYLAQVHRHNGMRSVDAALAAAVARRKVTLREAAAAAVDRKALVSLVRAQARERRAADLDAQRVSQRAAVVRTINQGA